MDKGITCVEFFTENHLAVTAPADHVMEFHTDEKFIYIVKLSVLGLKENFINIDPLEVLKQNTITYIYYMENDKEIKRQDILWHDEFEEGNVYIYDALTYNIGQTTMVDGDMVKIEIMK